VIVKSVDFGLRFLFVTASSFPRHHAPLGVSDCNNLASLSTTFLNTLRQQ